jgi:crossover junction endodeoxyribonuclease RuvC
MVFVYRGEKRRADWELFCVDWEIGYYTTKETKCQDWRRRWRRRTRVTIVAFDLSLTGTACATFTSTGILAEVLDTSNERGFPRIDKIVAFIDSQIENADRILIEDFSYNSRGNAILEQAGLQYIVRYVLWKSGHRFTLVAPATLKKFVTGKGKGGKEIVIKELFKNFGFDASDNNEADAVGLLYIGMALEGAYEPKNAAQRESVEVVRKRTKEIAEK